MIEVISNFIGAKAFGQAEILGISGLVFLVANWILSKFKIDKKISIWLNKAEIFLEAFFDKIIISVGIAGYNAGVALTLWLNKMPVLSTIYEKLIEPLLIILIESVLRLLSIILDKLSSLVLKFTNKLIVGMKSDNKSFDKKR